jgi:hypothetical protein
MDGTRHVAELYRALIYAYEHDDETNEEHDEYVDTLKAYTTAVVVATTQSVCHMLGVDMDDVQMLALTERQYHRLEESGMLDVYIDGKERLDD